MAAVKVEAGSQSPERRRISAIHIEAPNVFAEWHQQAGGGAHRQRRPSLAEVVGAAAPSAYPIFDLYLLARLSVQEAADGESLDDQVRQAKRDAADVLGVEEDRITFVDTDCDPIGKVQGPLVGISATHISGAVPWEQRRDLREVIEIARAGRVRAVITPNLDRVARNAEVAHRFCRELVSAGVRTLFEGCVPYDLIDDNQQLIYGIRAEFSAFERKIIARRMFGGKIQAARKGFYVGGGLPFGTALAKTGASGQDHRSKVVADAAAIEIVLALFEKRLQGVGVRELAAWTKAIGVVPRGHDSRSLEAGLTQPQIYRILRNRFYVTGDLTFHVTHPGWPVELIRQRIRLPRRVDQEVFDRVATMRRRRQGERQAAGSYLLAGLVYHRTSDTPFTSSSTKTGPCRYRYYCNREWAAAQRRLQAASAAADGSGRHRVRPIRASLRKDELEGAVLALLARAARDGRVLRTMLEVDREKEAAKRVAYGQNQKELRRTEAAADRLLEAMPPASSV